jgi:hypothetical protein
MYINRLMDIFGDEGPTAAQEEINREDFESWFENYKENNVENGRDEWKNVVSLYNL